MSVDIGSIQDTWPQFAKIMSYNHQTSYNYPVHADYYLDENDGFVGDYSDSDGFSENHHYHQQQMHPMNTYTAQAPVQSQPQQQQSLCSSRYHHSSMPYIQRNYQEQPQHRNVRPLHPQMHSNDIHHEYHCPLASSSQPVTNYQHTSAYTTNSYPSAAVNQPINRYPQTTTTRQQLPLPAAVDVIPCNRHQQPHRPINGKRHPVTVGTPKYYRKPSVSSSLYKRPSALCLPVASQPDPAIYRKTRKYPSYDASFQAQQVEKNSQRTPISRTDPSHLMQQPNMSTIIQPHQVHSEGDVNISNLDDMLDKVETGESHKITSAKTGLNKISKYFKPRLPPSLKTKQERHSIKSSELSESVPQDIHCVAKSIEEKKPDGMETHDVSTDSLEKLLTQLKKCELTSDTDDMERKEQRHMKKMDGDRGANIDDELKKHSSPSKPTSTMKSFNYRDILDNSDTKASSDSTSSIQDITRKLLLSSSTTNSATSNTHHHRPRTSSLIPKSKMLDDNCALELHRSKSYIVDLIDRALSKELGTVPGERSRKEFGNMSPKRAIDLVNRHVKPSQDLSLEITTTLTDSIMSNATAPEAPSSINSQRSSNNSSHVCCCAEEPTYIKQLKQLRWGHLKHIQREVKRLEDLERFLDSCSITTIPEDS